MIAAEERLDGVEDLTLAGAATDKSTMCWR